MTQLSQYNARYPHVDLAQMFTGMAGKCVSPSDFVNIVFTLPFDGKIPAASRKVTRPLEVRDIEPHHRGRCMFCSHGVLPLMDADGSSDEGDRRDNRFKTDLCRNFEVYGRCPYGKKCLFAHGEEELRPLRRNPLFKTSPCYWYHKVGICNHGKRCVFAHHLPYFDETTPNPSDDDMGHDHRLPIFSALTTIAKLEERVRLETVF
mmetsp:Transcript_17062/g.29512  ORF Transcript_17062/g.29512 Transcript_17062/m.29512 type:complete len:205 (-) Transcript_17062:711-1325(-)|eukprot:CAMPEP_0196664054 /NCGR_PEP_ID=MMETSP1086-20130531/55402_1 /TAXON_ID=77921 /ORGANISM="Cyanoptyche  gloeocystis , Strain SAG4.97" /LENGTH=204 /DNA_ID=CAMNT_0042000155 /DNA_START=115 /DNA_END=729 /DNA_ORIENTATION=-